MNRWGHINHHPTIYGPTLYQTQIIEVGNMTEQGNLFQRSNEYTLASDLVDSLISLLDLPNQSKLLVIEFGTQVSSDSSLEGHDVVYVQDNESPQEIVKKIQANGPYDGAIILPVFSLPQAHLKPPEGWEEIGRPTPEDWLIAHAINNLKPNGSLTALVPNGLLTNYGRQAMRQGLIECGLVMVSAIPTDLIYRDYEKVQVATALILLKNNQHLVDRSITFINWVNFDGLPPKDVWTDILTGEFDFDDLVRVPISDLEDNAYRLDPQYYDPTYLQIKAPPGYVEFTLGEIADIRGGFMVKKEDRIEYPDSANSMPFLQVRHILSSGEIANQVYWIDPSKVPAYNERLALPGDILITVAGTIGKAVMVPSSFADGVFFDTSIRRVRVYNDAVKPEWVLQFFQSEIGQLQFRRLTSGSTIPQITSPFLESMSIFLPEPKEGIDNVTTDETLTTDITGNQAQANLIANAIQENVVNYLRSIKPDDGSWNETIEKTLSNLTKNLIPKPLKKLILEDFPTPIAIPYRRFNMARYNPYERLDRMVTLVESCVYFVFHVLSVDYWIHGWKKLINISRDAKQALQGTQSIDYRLKFIEEVLEVARSGSISLFIPELINTEIAAIGDQLRNEVRNPIAHSAPGSEPYVRSIIDKYLPGINKLLESLRFLDNYTLCRIRNHYYQNGQWRYQAEIYRGAEYDLNIQDSSFIDDTGESQLIEAERDHLIILSPDAETLDMHPFYQLYFGDETARESHLCFYKHRQRNRLVGESIRSSVEIDLLGIEDFQSLTGINIGNNNQDD
jgi:hypothetical protein